MNKNTKGNLTGALRAATRQTTSLRSTLARLTRGGQSKNARNIAKIAGLTKAVALWEQRAQQYIAQEAAAKAAIQRAYDIKIHAVGPTHMRQAIKDEKRLESEMRQKIADAQRRFADKRAQEEKDLRKYTTNIDALKRKMEARNAKRTAKLMP